MHFRLFIGIVFLFCFACNNKEEESPFLLEEELISQTSLNDQINESSGLIMVDGKIWTHNDSGDGAIIYRILETNTSIEEDVQIINASNNDWEDLAQDEQFIYIGDFGNNSGNRQDLTIYQVPKSNLPDDSEAALIRFSFEDQINFDNPYEDHNFNCEAMVTVGEKIFLFTKNHKDQQTKLYSINKVPGIQIAQKIDEFNSEGLITGAGIDKNSNTLCLLGYNTTGTTFQPFIWLFYEYPGNQFFDGKSKRINLSIPTQMEGICYRGNGKFLISSENELNSEAALYLFDAEKWKE